MRVELVGGMASGKSTLAKLLQEKGASWVAEVLEDNPFLEPCYHDFDTYKFPSQMWFALTKYYEIGTYDDDSKIYVHDQAVINNNAYTNLMYAEDLDSEEHELITKMFDKTVDYFGKPDQIIWIHTSPTVQLERIKKRGREYELDIDHEFLSRLENEITQLMFQAYKIGYNVIEVDGDTIDFENNPEFVEALWQDLKGKQEELLKSLTEPLEQQLKSGTTK